MKHYSHMDNKKIYLDAKLDNLFKSKKNGFYIELGANNGLIQSNTAFFEKYRNWTGVLIEPSYKAFLDCKKNRPKSLCLHYACISDKYNNKTILGDFNSTKLMASINGKRLNSSKLVNVPAITLEKILDKCLDNRSIDFLSLDTEGYELNILEGLNLDKYRPTYLLIEIYEKDREKIFNFLELKKYKLHSNFSNYNKKDNPGWDGSHNDYLFTM